MANVDMIPQPTPNLPLLRKVLDHIDAHPEEYQQRVYMRPTACGTACCIAGHVAVMSGAQFINEVTVQTLDGRQMSVSEYGYEALGITNEEAFCPGGLFAGDSTRTQVQRAAERIAARAGERL